VVIFTMSAFALWRLEGSCRLTLAEDELRALRGEWSSAASPAVGA
jgi:hypothetical protein